MKKTPQRTCIACREKNDKKNLIRIVRDKKNQTVFLDRSGKANGRGCYVCKKSECAEKATNPKLLKHHLNVAVEQETADELKAQILEYITQEV